MQDPVRELPHVIRLLTESETLNAQRIAVEKYFTFDAEFEHPLCTVRSQRSTSIGGVKISSRDLLLGVYQWYKVLFTNSHLDIRSLTYNKDLRKVYVEIDQTVTYKYIPIPWRTTTASLLTVITLRKGFEQRPPGFDSDDDEGHADSEAETRELWYISKQEDLYQTDEWVKYLLPGAREIVHLCKVSVGYMCSVGAVVGKGLKLC